MSYFPCDIPFMSDDELKENGIKIPKDVAETNIGNTDYIRREDAITAACKGFCHPGVRCPDEPCRKQTKYLRELPPADVVQVVHGKWIDDGTEFGCQCSECGKSLDDYVALTEYVSLNEIPNFCPNCGAKMDGEG